VALVAIEGKAETLAAALRYMIFALTRIAAYLLGVVLLYAAHGTLDIDLIAGGGAHPPTCLHCRADDRGAGLPRRRSFRSMPGCRRRMPARRRRPGHAVGAGAQGVLRILLRLWFEAMPDCAGRR
jgi:multicomponent Na+:H+ antiporter subunit D